MKLATQVLDDFGTRTWSICIKWRWYSSWTCITKLLECDFLLTKRRSGNCRSIRQTAEVQKQISTLYGGKAAEEIHHLWASSELVSGASNKISKWQLILQAQNLNQIIWLVKVKKWGFSDENQWIHCCWRRRRCWLLIDDFSVQSVLLLKAQPCLSSSFCWGNHTRLYNWRRSLNCAGWS